MGGARGCLRLLGQASGRGLGPWAGCRALFALPRNESSGLWPLPALSLGTPQCALSRGQQGESWGLFCSRLFKQSGSGELSPGPKQAAPSFPGWDVALLQGATGAGVGEWGTGICS